ncbi:MAG: DUF4372 domain-containing protein [Burkholderiales bacterium]|nr:DUF4372 domain-containing protein [Burkholderiales bacterium]
MPQHNNRFAQILKRVPKHEFERLADEHHQGQQLRRLSRWSPFVALGMAQPSGRCSLRDGVSNGGAQRPRFITWVAARVTRSSLSRVKEHQPHTFYEALFDKLYSRCQTLAPKHRFRLKNKLYSLDGSRIDLSLSIFPWGALRGYAKAP